jgi:hypothetical protein
VADESVVVRRVRTTEPYRSEGALLYLKSFDRGEAGKSDKSFRKSAGAEEKDIQQGEDRFGWKRWSRKEISDMRSLPESSPNLIGG